MARGHIRERKGAKGPSYEVRIYAGRDPATGRERRLTRTVQTKREAERTLTRLLAEVDKGGHSGPRGSFDQLVDQWWEAHSADWSPSTAAAFRSYLDTHLRPAFGSTLVGSLRASDLDTLYGRMRARGLKPASIRKAHVIVHRVLAQGLRWGWVSSNVAEQASPPPVRRRELEPPEPSEVRRLLALVDEVDPDFACFLHLAATTGARRGELCALRWSDLEADTVRIARSVVQGERSIAVKDTKTHQVRRLTLDTFTLARVALHRRRCVERALAFGVPLGPDAFVFTMDPAASKPWRPDGVTARFRRLRDRAGLPNVRLHDLRHYSVTQLLAAGVDQRTVMGRVGHASLASLTRYSHFVPAADREAAEKVARSLEG